MFQASATNRKISNNFLKKIVILFDVFELYEFMYLLNFQA